MDLFIVKTPDGAKAVVVADGSLHAAQYAGRAFAKRGLDGDLRTLTVARLGALTDEEGDFDAVLAVDGGAS